MNRFLRNILDYMSNSNYTNVGKKNIDEHKINLVNIFEEWAKGFYSENKIELENITINQNGLISGNNYETYEDALDAFMEILSKLRRNIR